MAKADISSMSQAWKKRGKEQKPSTKDVKGCLGAAQAQLLHLCLSSRMDGSGQEDKI